MGIIIEDFNQMEQKKYLINVKRDKVTNHYKFIKEVYSSFIQLGRGASGVCFQVQTRDDNALQRCIKKIPKSSSASS